jgi:hypothetical protein
LTSGDGGLPTEPFAMTVQRAEGTGPDDKPTDPAADASRGEIVIFPRIDFGRIAAALSFWRKTGKAYQEPEPDAPASGAGGDPSPEPKRERPMGPSPVPPEKP